MKNILLTCLFSFLSILLFSQKEFKTHSVSIFKDGTVFLDKSKTLDAKDGKVVIEELPFSKNSGSQQYILFGTIWMVAPNNSIPFAKISQKRSEREKEMTSLNLILGQNVKKQIKVTQKNGPAIQGVLQLLDDNSLIIKKENKWIRIPKNEMTSFEFLEDIKTTMTIPSSQKILELNFEKKVKQQHFHLMYLQKGMVWAPNYFLQILGNQKARLSLKANVMNDLEDLENVELNFVVGIPAFKYERTRDPFVSSTNIQSFLNSLNQGNYEPVITFDPETYEEQIQMVPAAPKDTEGVKNEDLFFYRKQNVTLEAGGRAMFDILETEFDYKDVYTVQIKKNSTQRNYQNNDQEHQKNTVWHTLNFKNKTDFPFTAGSVFFLKKGKGAKNMPIGQNQILYTPPTGDAEVRMAIASDIFVLDADKEIKREKNKRGSDDLITIEGSIDIINYQNQSIQLKIEREITGNVLESDFAWETTGLTTQLNSLNKKFNTKWEFELKANETKKIIYTYEVYVK